MKKQGFLKCSRTSSEYTGQLNSVVSIDTTVFMTCACLTISLKLFPHSLVEILFHAFSGFIPVCIYCIFKEFHMTI